MPKRYKISVLPGDGIGKEVTSEAVRVIKFIESSIDGIEFDIHNFDCGGEYYLKEGREWSLEAETFTKKDADAILLGAIGAIGPDGKSVRLPDNNLAGYSVVLGLRFELDLFANVRPVKLYEGVPTPLLNKTHKDIDMTIIRENTEGLYAPTRGTLSRGDEDEVAIDSRVITRKGSERVTRQAFERAMKRGGAPSDNVRRVTCVDKSNLLAGCQLFRKVFDEVSNDFPEVERDYAYVDAWTQWCLKKPEYYDVVVAPNAFGDIITDLGGAIQGGLGMAPAGNIGVNHGVFEPVHGSAPKHAGKSIANPTAAVLASSMMLSWLGSRNNDTKLLKGAEIITSAVESVLRDGKIRTYDLCLNQWENVKPVSTMKMADAYIEAIKQATSEV